MANYKLSVLLGAITTIFKIIWNQLYRTAKSEVKLVRQNCPAQCMAACGGSGSTVSIIPKLDTIWGWMVSLARRPLSSWGKRVPATQEVGWARSRSGGQVKHKIWESLFHSSFRPLNKTDDYLYYTFYQETIIYSTQQCRQDLWISSKNEELLSFILRRLFVELKTVL